MRCHGSSKILYGYSHTLANVLKRAIIFVAMGVVITLILHWSLVLFGGRVCVVRLCKPPLTCAAPAHGVNLVFSIADSDVKRCDAEIPEASQQYQNSTC